MKARAEADHKLTTYPNRTQSIPRVQELILETTLQVGSSARDKGA